MLDFCIIGSGVSGSTIAYILSKKYNVEIFDKARGIAMFEKKTGMDNKIICFFENFDELLSKSIFVL